MAQLRLGLIGLGALGSRIATRLLRTGFSLEVYDIADVAVRMFNMDVGGIVTGSPKMMAQSCDVIITVLPSAAEVREVAFGWEGLGRGFTKGGVLIDMGCSDPMATNKLAEELACSGILGGILRRQVLTRQFDTGLALGHLLKSLETASSVALTCGVQAPLLAACRDTWAAAETRLGSGADQSALIRWLETLVPEPRT
jgi:3-hydroxyisobutyrate dehydrogenase-like beta-hydroxyacid dehydrogenase